MLQGTRTHQTYSKRSSTFLLWGLRFSRPCTKNSLSWMWLRVVWLFILSAWWKEERSKQRNMTFNVLWNINVPLQSPVHNKPGWDLLMSERSSENVSTRLHGVIILVLTAEMTSNIDNKWRPNASNFICTPIHTYLEIWRHFLTEYSKFRLLMYLLFYLLSPKPRLTLQWSVT